MKMLVFLVGVGVGAFVGWNMPQPKWAADFQAKVTAYFNESK